MVATQKGMKQEVPVLGSPSTGDLKVCGKGGDASLGSVTTTGTDKVPDTCLGSPSGASSEAPSLALGLACC